MISSCHFLDDGNFGDRFGNGAQQRFAMATPERGQSFGRLAAIRRTGRGERDDSGWRRTEDRKQPVPELRERRMGRLDSTYPPGVGDDPSLTGRISGVQQREVTSQRLLAAHGAPVGFGRRKRVFVIDEFMPLRLTSVCIDRQITRLNSSHVTISYTVFCI